MRAFFLRWLVVVAASAVVMAGCSVLDPVDSDPLPSATPSVEGTVESVSFAALGIDGWSDVGTFAFPAAPAAPAGVSVDAWAKGVSTIEDWAKQAAFDPAKLPTKFEPLASKVFADLPSLARKDLTARLAERTAPRLGVANVFKTPVAVRKVKATALWRVTAIEEGVQVLELQTRTAYEVETGGGATTVLGMIRSQGLAFRPGVEDAPGTTTGWQEFGASDCALALNDALEPQPDNPKEVKDVRDFAKYGTAKEWANPPLDEDDVVDEDFLANCRSSQT